MDVSVIVVNYNTYKLTYNCINSIRQFTRDIAYEIILVDNNSVELEQVPFEKLFPDIKVIRLQENGGFAKGSNAGIKEAIGDYILLLNSDTVLKENSVKITFNYLFKHPQVGVVSARMVFPKGGVQSVAQRFPSIRYNLMEVLRLQKILPRNLSGKLLLGTFFNHEHNTKADWVWGTYFMFPKKILQQLTGNILNERYFMYMEDMQWCKDIHKIGYEIHFCAETEIIHIMGGSKGAKYELMEKNYLTFLKLNYSPWHRYLIQWLNKLTC